MSDRDTSLPIPARVEALLAQMTLDEKLAQLNSAWAHQVQSGSDFSTAKAGQLLAHGIGQITRSAGDTTLEPAAVARFNNALQAYLVKETRLGLPAIVHEECCAGYMGLGGTVYPQMLGLASTWRPELAERMTAEIRRQLRAVGAHEGLAPVLDVARDPRWGRVEETFGEDALLVSHFGVAYIQGLQGESLKDGGVMATAKHFIGHSFSQGGQNCAPVRLGLSDLWNIYMLPFQAAIRAGLHTVMNAYPELDGELVAASRRILTELLREKLGFNGLVVSDYEAVPMIHTYHRAAATRQEAAVLGLSAGIDVELPTVDCYGEHLKAALAAGEISLEIVETSVRRHLAKKFELGLFENPFVDEGRVLEIFETPAQRGLAREIANQGLVLLKNNGLLPLKREIKTLAVIGPNAHNPRTFLGDYSYNALFELMGVVPAAGPSNFSEPESAACLAEFGVPVVTALNGLRTLLPTTKLLYAPGCDNLADDASGFEAALEAAQAAEAVVLVLGDKAGLAPHCTVGETRDSADLRLPGLQEQLAEAILATGKPVAVVLVTGRPYAINTLAEKADAILWAGIPGEEGGHAIAETLLGQNNPGGKLVMSYPRHVGQVPLFYNQKPSGGKSNWYWNYVNVESSPLYPFGHGLSYTKFAYTGLELSSRQLKSGETLQVQVKVTNTGPVAGDEVVQLYVCDEYGSVPRPVKELRGYTRLSLQSGETRTVRFHLPIDVLAYYDLDLNLVVERGTFKLLVGSSSADIRAAEAFEVVGEKKALVKDRVWNCPAEVE
jgi:beta-glucosidase